MPIDENCVNTLRDQISKLYQEIYHGTTTRWPIYRSFKLEPITPEQTEEDKRDVYSALSAIDDDVKELSQWIKYCKR